MTEALISTIDINKTQKGKTLRDIPSAKMIKETAQFFKEKNIIKPAKWGDMVKTSHANDIHPNDQDYWFSRAAAICRILYLTSSKNFGVGKLRVIFGMKKRRGAQPPKFFRSGGRIIRNIVAQLKAAHYVASYENSKESDEDITCGLHLTTEGRAELDKIAAKIAKQ